MVAVKDDTIYKLIISKIALRTGGEPKPTKKPKTTATKKPKTTAKKPKTTATKKPKTTATKKPKTTATTIVKK